MVVADILSCYEVKLLIDRQERNGSTGFSNETLQQLLKAEGIACATRDLSVGAILWTARKVGSRKEYVLPTVIERTSHHDLGNSMAEKAKKHLPMTRLMKQLTSLKLSEIPEKIYLLELPPGQRDGTKTKNALQLLWRDDAVRTVETRNIHSTVSFLKQKHEEVLFKFEKLLQRAENIEHILPTYKQVGNKVKNGLPTECQRLRGLRSICGNSSCTCVKATFEHGEDCRICSLPIQLGDCVDRWAFNDQSIETWPIHVNCSTSGRSNSMLACISQIAEDIDDTDHTENLSTDSLESRAKSSPPPAAARRKQTSSRGYQEEVQEPKEEEEEEAAAEGHAASDHTEVVPSDSKSIRLRKRLAPNRTSSSRRERYQSKVLLDLTV